MAKSKAYKADEAAYKKWWRDLRRMVFKDSK